ncbi:MAG: hypothetical protein FGO69_09660 [Methanobacterium sp.]|nr:MAG: hypothetical protein FGO69_09660 [Methanobacterium sp.]
MDQKNAFKLLDDTFNQDFNLDRFSRFIKELFNHFNLRINKSIPLRKEFYDYIEQIDSLGVYKDDNLDSLEVFAVKLKKISTRDRARTMQRNLIAKYLKNSGSNAALVAFYGDDPEDWRFSFVKIEYELIKDVKGNLTVQEEITPAKRYSFLVGKNEPNHTCKRQFLSLIKEENNDPLLRQIEEAFSIETVTVEFFKKYENLFKKLQKSLINIIKENEDIKKEFEDKKIPTADFTKKLLGQIVFLYFLQKKGWLGVERDRSWGTGSKDFLKKLFNKEIVPYNNYFNDILEPLFYEALATERLDDYYSQFNCKIPFLNGGLFEPINEYDWIRTDIKIDDKIFENIFQTFDSFNFTVKEDEPLEKEVAVDPEMLGKVFENLLEVIDRKKKGAFYTPREIVHYMCQQSLINYLNTHLDIPEEDIENLILFADFTLDSIIKVQEQIKKYGKPYDDYKIPKSIEENYDRINELLKEIKVVDPAVGSGAFPVGMMNEIVKVRSILSLINGEEKTHYELKREIIENSLYGVDIDSSAVDIAKLRFWLSLIVDETNIKNIKPLPNLDHKIMCGNSIMDEFDGIKLFDESLLNSMEDNPEKDKIDAEIKNLKEQLKIQVENNASSKSRIIIENHIKRLRKKEKRLINKIDPVSQSNLFEKEKEKKLRILGKKIFNEESPREKKRYKDEIENIHWNLITETLKEEGKLDAIDRLNEYKKNKSKPFFLWKLYFLEIFQRENPGFDVVIGNPPYGFRNVLTKDEKEYFRKIKKISFPSGDSAELFSRICFENLVRFNGVLSFIIPKKSLYGDSWEEFREDYLNKYNILFILDSSKAFEKVLLEAEAFALQKNMKDSCVKLSFLTKKDIVKEFSKTKKEMIFMPNRTIQIYKSLYPHIFKNIEDKSIIGGFVEGILGLPIGRDFYSDTKDEFKLLKGIDIERWVVKDHRYLKNKDNLNWDNAKVFLKPKIIAQRIVAHIENPVPHIKLTACLDDEGIIITNTLIAFELDNKINPKYWLGYLNSKFLSWYAYNFIYSRAIRTMDLYNTYIQQLPIPKIILTNQDYQKSIIDLVDQILMIQKNNKYTKDDANIKTRKLELEIDKLVCESYGMKLEELEGLEKLI